MRSNAFVFCCLTLASCVLTGCKPKRPSGILSEGKNDNIYFNYSIDNGCEIFTTVIKSSSNL
jgi:hypothetical protein